MERMLQAMEVFARIVECENFTRASNLLGIPKASASLLIQQLEVHLQVKLLHRTTRQVRPTSAGMTFYEYCLKILADITDLRSKIGSCAGQASGKLRVELPGDIARQLMPHIARFRLQYPDVSLQVSTPRHSSNLIRDGIDCAVRLGELEDSCHFSRQVGTYQLITVASRSLHFATWMSRHGAKPVIASHGARFPSGRRQTVGIRLRTGRPKHPAPAARIHRLRRHGPAASIWFAEWRGHSGLGYRGNAVPCQRTAQGGARALPPASPADPCHLCMQDA